MKKLLMLLCVLSLFCSAAFAETEQIAVDFNGSFGAGTRTVQVRFDTDWFSRPSETYNHALAQLSIAAATAAFRDNTVGMDRADHYIREFFETVDFENYTAFSYHEPTRRDTISNAIAMKSLSDSAGDYVLLAVPICGQGYKNEWLGNFSMEEGDFHTGFSVAAQQVYERILDYIEEHGLSGLRIKVWVTGFSRSAAVSDLVGCMLLEDSRFEDNDIFVYAFAAPNATKDPQPLPQIHIVCNSFDPVSHVPFTEWGYGKYGTIRFLPALETTPDYDVKIEKAREQYAKMAGSADGFRPMTERNWLINRILELVYTAAPKASSYMSDYQNAIIAAWGTEGGVLEKLAAFEDELEKVGQFDTEALNAAGSDLMALVGSGVSDTLKLISGSGGTSTWYELISSGKQLAYEHVAENYLAWMLSSDDPDELFGPDSYLELIFTGDVTVSIEADGKVLYGDGVCNASVVRLLNQTYVSLPVGRACTMKLTAGSETRFQAACNETPLLDLIGPAYGTIPITLYSGETVTITIPGVSGAKPAIALEDGTELLLYDGESTGILRLEDLNDAGIGDYFRSVATSLLTVIPWYLLSIILILHVFLSVLNRVVRGRVDDRFEPRTAGTVLLTISAVLSALFALAALMMALKDPGTQQTLMDHTLQRASELLNLGSDIFLGSQIVIYGGFTILSIRGIRHILSRKRLIRLSLLLLLTDTVTLIAAVGSRTVQFSTVIPLLIPAAAISGALLVHRHKAQIIALQRTLAPISRLVLFTMLLYSARQLYILFFAESTQMEAVVMKALTGIPVLILAVATLRRNHAFHRRLHAYALLCYFAANTIINLSLFAGIAAFTLGHVFLTWASLSRRKPSRVQFISWGMLLVLCEAELFVLPFGFTLPVRLAAMVYIAAALAAAVAAFPLSSRLRYGILLFIIANQVLAVSFLLPENFVVDSVELLLYYVAIITITPDWEAMQAASMLPEDPAS